MQHVRIGSHRRISAHIGYLRRPAKPSQKQLHGGPLSTRLARLRMEKFARYCWLFIIAACLCARGQDTGVPVYYLQVFAGGWTLETNDDSTVLATDHAISRIGNEVFTRIWLLKPVIVKPGITMASPDTVRAFIHQYKPPPIPYTSPAKARQSNSDTFDCVQFADDIVAQAASNNIASEVVGILFENHPIGHACAAFPTTDGGVLFFDSTPGAHRISRHAYEASVEVGQTYRRADGAELGDGMERVPISDIVPVSGIVQSGPQYEDPPKPVVLTPETTFILQSEDRIQTPGILYTDTNGFTVSQKQLYIWAKAVEAEREQKKEQQDEEMQMINDQAARRAAKSLRDTEEAAARGDAFAELRMGQRYLEGDGVPKDVLKARKFLQDAADQGSPTAVEELERLQ
jgi:hypothetical protein